jgi:predicted RNase H-like HicB family nuclease
VRSGGNGRPLNRSVRHLGKERRKITIAMNFEIECEREDDGRWLAEVAQLPGVLAYGDSANDAMAKAQILALRVLAERLENSETGPQAITFSIAA